MKLRFGPLAGLPFLALVACCGLFQPTAGEGSLVVMSYNVQALFDPVDQGTEYADYSVARGSWDEARYLRRLGKLAEVILAASPSSRGRPPGPDLLCLEEVESEAVLAALSAGALAEGRYRYRAFAGSPGSALGIGLLSRLPILASRAHGLRIEDLVLRPVLEVELETSGGPLLVFVCHWKSKSEGAAATEAARREGAALLSRLVLGAAGRRPGAAILACGDFNESPDEYLRIGRRYPTALLPAALAPELGGRAASSILVAALPSEAGLRAGRPVLYSPWAEASGYSYMFDGKAERIDGFLLGSGLLDGEGLVHAGFTPFDADFLMDAEGKPLAWSSSRATGYSDHLPVLLYLETASPAPKPRPRRKKSQKRKVELPYRAAVRVKEGEKPRS